MRQRLLAHAMERSGELDADTVRVLHVASAVAAHGGRTVTDSESGTEHELPFCVYRGDDRLQGFGSTD